MLFLLCLLKSRGPINNVKDHPSKLSHLSFSSPTISRWLSLRHPGTTTDLRGNEKGYKLHACFEPWIDMVILVYYPVPFTLSLSPRWYIDGMQNQLSNLFISLLAHLLVTISWWLPFQFKKFWCCYQFESAEKHINVLSDMLLEGKVTCIFWAIIFVIVSLGSALVVVDHILPATILVKGWFFDYSRSKPNAKF